MIVGRIRAETHHRRRTQYSIPSPLAHAAGAATARAVATCRRRLREVNLEVVRDVVEAVPRNSRRGA
jgi:hypothetical protein